LKSQQAHFYSDKGAMYNTASVLIMYGPYFSCPKCIGATCSETCSEGWCRSVT